MKIETPLPPEASPTLITGASSGIGLALAEEFAGHGHPVLLVGSVAAEIEQVAGEIAREFGVAATAITADLRRPDAFERIRTQAAEVEILVNNAGFGRRGRFWEVEADTLIDMMRVDVESVVRLTRLFLPRMVARGHGRVLNTASIAGFEPAPLMATYHASTAFVRSLSAAVAAELEDTGVTLTALCHGPVDTDFLTRAERIESAAFPQGAVIAPREVAAAAYTALMRGDRLVVPGAANRAMVFGRRIMPIGTQARLNRKQHEDVAPEKRPRERGDSEPKDEATAAGKTAPS